MHLPSYHILDDIDFTEYDSNYALLPFSITSFQKVGGSQAHLEESPAEEEKKQEVLGSNEEELLFTRDVT